MFEDDDDKLDSSEREKLEALVTTYSALDTRVANLPHG